MLNALLRLLDDSNLGYLQNRIDCLSKALGSSLTSFEETEDGYELRYKVADEATGANAPVDYDEETRQITIEYAFTQGNLKSYATIKEVLPKNADDTTIEAAVRDGELIVTVDRLPEEQPAEEEPLGDDTTVVVRRKRK